METFSSVLTSFPASATGEHPARTKTASPSKWIVISKGIIAPSLHAGKPRLCRPDPPIRIAACQPWHSLWSDLCMPQLGALAFSCAMQDLLVERRVGAHSAQSGAEVAK